jgi:hypothetical protein
MRLFLEGVSGGVGPLNAVAHRRRSQSRRSGTVAELCRNNSRFRKGQETPGSGHILTGNASW